jgi:DNA-binding response OmpR family regulator
MDSAFSRPLEILVVDDDPQLRLALAHILRRAGHAVGEAGDGDAALKCVFDPPRHYDVILIDMVMPGKEGVETILELRRRGAQARIIAMSGGGRIDHYDPLRLAAQCGARAVIAKPFEPAALCALVLDITAP